MTLNNQGSNPQNINFSRIASQVVAEDLFILIYFLHFHNPQHEALGLNLSSIYQYQPSNFVSLFVSLLFVILKIKKKAKKKKKTKKNKKHSENADTSTSVTMNEGKKMSCL